MSDSRFQTSPKTEILIPRGFSPSGKNADRLAILAADLMRRTSLTTERRRHGHFIPFGREHWRRVIGGDYGPIRREAIEVGLIEPNDRYSCGAFPKSLRLAKNYRTGKVDTYKQKRRRCSRSVDAENLKPSGMWLLSRFDCFQLDHSGRLDPWSAFSRAMIQRGDYFAVRCEYGRFHSNFSSLSKLLRPHLQTDELLVEVDVENCQPLLLTITGKGREKGKRGGNPSTIPICDMVSHSETQKSDWRKWLDLCEAGALYEFFLERFHSGEVEPFTIYSRGRSYHIDPARMTRSQVKQQFLVAMFAPPAQTKRNPCYQIMLQHFPEVAESIHRLKRHAVYKHRNLAMKLQRAESSIIIDGVCERLRSDHSSEYVLTIHDAVICRQSFVETLQDLIREEFKRYGIAPSLRVSPLKNGGSTR